MRHRQGQAGPDLETIALWSCASAELVQEDKTIILLTALLPCTHTTQSSQDQFHILTTDMTTHAQHLYRIALHGSGHNIQVWLTQPRLSQVRMKAAMASDMSCIWTCRSFDTEKHGAG